jgi:hypothetical protein
MDLPAHNTSSFPRQNSVSGPSGLQLLSAEPLCVLQELLQGTAIPPLVADVLMGAPAATERLERARAALPTANARGDLLLVIRPVRVEISEGVDAKPIIVVPDHARIDVALRRY